MSMLFLTVEYTPERGEPNPLAPFLVVAAMALMTKVLWDCYCRWVAIAIPVTLSVTFLDLRYNGNWSSLCNG